MRKLFCLLVLFSSILWSCNKGENEVKNPDTDTSEENVYLDVYPSEVVFDAQGGAKNLQVECYIFNTNGTILYDCDWTITGGNEWCRTNVTTGSSYEYVTVTVDAYSGIEDRNTNLTIKAGDKTYVLTVTQKHGAAIILSKDKFDVPEEGGEVTVEVKSNIEYQVEIPFLCRSWIKQAPESRAVTVKNFTFVISENETYEKREGYIVFKGNSLKDTVYVYQTADTRTLILTQDSYDIASTGGAIEVELKANVDYSVTIPSVASRWISLIQPKASRTDKLLLEIAENTDYDNRSTKIVIKDRNSSLSDTLCINQMQQNTLILGKKKYELLAGGGQVSVEVKSNVDYEVSVSQTGQSWIQKAPESRGLTTSMLTYIILANSSENCRLAEIIIKDKNSRLADTIQVFQGGKGIYVGDIILTTEQDLIDFYAAEYTKIIGNLTIRGDSLKTLQRLDNLLVEIDGSLTLNCFSLTSLDGLYGLKTITNSLIVKFGRMESFEGLRDLQTIGGSFKVIAEKSLNALKSFQGLNGLKSIGGDFEVNASSYKYTSYSLNSLESFEGLENLQTIGGSFKVIAKSKSDSTNYNNSNSNYNSLTALKSFQGLNRLKSIGGDFEVNASSYTSPASSYEHTSYSLNSLESFEGLENLQTIGGSFKVIAKSESKSESNSNSNSNSLTALKSFQGLNGLKSIGGDFEVNASSSTNTFSINTQNSFSLNSLESFEGLENLQTIGGSFRVIAKSRTSNQARYNYNANSNSNSLTALKSFQGLSGLKSIGGDLEVNASSPFYGNKTSTSTSYSLNSLESFEGLENLQTIGGSFRVIAESELCYNSESESLNTLKSFQGLNGLKSIGGDFEVNASYSSDSHSTNGASSLGSLESFEGLENLQTIGGSFKVITKRIRTALKSFQGLNGLKSIGGDFEVDHYYSPLRSFEGLEDLQTIGGNFNSSNISTKGLSQLNSIGGRFNIYLNVDEGLENLQTIGGDFIPNASSFKALGKLSNIGGNFHVDFTGISFEGLENLQTIGGGKLTIEGYHLNNIDALKNLKSITEISITNCYELYDFCVLKNIVQNMSGTFYVNGCGYNPTKQQLLNGACSPISSN